MTAAAQLPMTGSLVAPPSRPGGGHHNTPVRRLLRSFRAFVGVSSVACSHLLSPRTLTRPSNI